MCTLYYHAGASAAAAGRGLGVLDVRGDDRGLFGGGGGGGGTGAVPLACLAHASARRFPFLTLQLYFNFTPTLLSILR